MSQFMDVVTSCMEASGADPLQVRSLTEAFNQIARDRPELEDRYDRAIALRDAREIERIWFECNRVLHTSLRINGVTGRLHIGHGHRSFPLFPLPN